MSSFGAVATGVAIAVSLAVLWLVYLALVLSWQDERTRGTRYFGLPSLERARFRRRLRHHARLVRPLLHLLARTAAADMSRASFRALGIAGPRGSCSAESFARAAAYRPDERDVFVVTQMRSGTTWMQHLVVQVLARGRSDFAENGESLHALSPWLEGLRTIDVTEAPSIGTLRPSRVIKTHLPADVCPISPDARYVYVARHPASCFASCVDYVAANLGPFAPPRDQLAVWFCSEAMWWGSWPRHVEGWWRLARREENALFVHFEEMKADLASVTRRLNHFLSLPPLDDAALADVLRRCSHDAMRSRAESFGMSPPSLVAVDADLLPSGSAERYRDLPEDVRRSVERWCRDRMAEAAFPMERAYPSELTPTD